MIQNNLRTARRLCRLAGKNRVGIAHWGCAIPTLFFTATLILSVWDQGYAPPFNMGFSSSPSRRHVRFLSLAVIISHCHLGPLIHCH